MALQKSKGNVYYFMEIENCLIAMQKRFCLFILCRIEKAIGGWWSITVEKMFCLTSLSPVTEWQHKMSSNMSVIKQIDPGFLSGSMELSFFLSSSLSDIAFYPISKYIIYSYIKLWYHKVWNEMSKWHFTAILLDMIFLRDILAWNWHLNYFT